MGDGVNGGYLRGVKSGEEVAIFGCWIKVLEYGEFVLAKRR